MKKQEIKEKITSVVESFSKDGKASSKTKKIALLIIILLSLPIFCIFFKLFVGLAAILFGIVFVLLILFFLAPEILKSLAKRGFLHAKIRGYFVGERKYTPFDNNNNGILLNLEHPVSSVSLKAMKVHIRIREHDDPHFQIRLSSENHDLEQLTFFTHYDEVTASVTVEQGPETNKSVKLFPYNMTIFLPKGHKIRVFSARIIEGSLTQTESLTNQLIEILDLDGLNTVLRLEDIAIPILRINGLNLTLESRDIFIRYFYINAAGSSVNLSFDQEAVDFCGKIKSHAVLSEIYLNNEIRNGLSGASPSYLWGDGESARSIMFSVNLLRTKLSINVPKTATPG